MTHIHSAMIRCLIVPAILLAVLAQAQSALNPDPPRLPESTHNLLLDAKVSGNLECAPKGGARMFACDVDGDGDNDIITSLDAHGWGLAWFQQVKDAGKITFREHKIMGDRSAETECGVAFSQPHPLDLADIDGDGPPDILRVSKLGAFVFLSRADKR